MPLSFLPKAIFQKLTDITPQYLNRQHIRLVMLDFDNTMLPYTSTEPTPELLRWLDTMKQAGVELCVVSNSRKAKASDFCQLYGINCITRARKPFSKGLRQCQRQCGVAPKQAAMVGDQIYTDVLGANGVGAFSILVKPIHLHNIWLRLRHVAEQPFIFLARKRSVTHEES